MHRDWYKIEMIILSANSNNIEHLLPAFPLPIQFMHFKFTFIYDNLFFKDINS